MSDEFETNSKLAALSREVKGVQDRKGNEIGERFSGS